MYSVAVVEDVSDNRHILRLVLEPHFRVTEFENGRRFIEELERADFDVALLDISMPEMDGFQVLDYLQKHPKHCCLPVLAVTAHAMKGDRERALAAGFWDYIPKPFEFDDLIARVDHSLKRCESRRESRE